MAAPGVTADLREGWEEELLGRGAVLEVIRRCTPCFSDSLSDARRVHCPQTTISGSLRTRWSGWEAEVVSQGSSGNKGIESGGNDRRKKLRRSEERQSR